MYTIISIIYISFAEIYIKSHTIFNSIVDIFYEICYNKDAHI